MARVLIGNIKGPKGDTGATGATGATGPTGPQGNPGAVSSMTIGTVTTLPSGAPATVSLDGTAEDPILNFGIPRGLPGDNSNVFLFDEDGRTYINTDE